MSEFITPEHKIVALILEASGEPADFEYVLRLCDEDDIEQAVRQLRETVIKRISCRRVFEEAVQTNVDSSSTLLSDSNSHPQNTGENENTFPVTDAVHADIETTGNEAHETDNEMPGEAASGGVQVNIEEDIAETKNELPLTPDTVQPKEQATSRSAETNESVPPVAASALRPGEVPQRASKEDSPFLQKTPEVSIVLPNARVGERFDVSLEIVTDNGAPAEITEINLPQDIGLIFNHIERRLQGTPTRSGDFELSVKWSCSTHPDNEKKLLFVVNPDPKSLWKVIDPPSDGPFYKDSIVHKGVSQSGIHIAGASRRGRSHEHVGSFRDDDFYLNFSEVSGWSVLLVADGAGSAKFSREGSRIVADTVGNYLFNQLKGEKGHEIKDKVLRWNNDDQRVVWDFMNHHFRQAAVLAVNNISSAAIMAEDKVKSFSTTLLATVTFRDGADLFAASFWLGDGAIAAYGPAGKVRVLGTPDSGEYAGQTRFLDAEAVSDAGFSKRISIGKWSDISHLVLMTDGVSDPWFETDNGLQNPVKWDKLMTELSPLLSAPEKASEQLVGWLNFFSPGNHDDRTIIVLW